MAKHRISTFPYLCAVTIAFAVVARASFGAMDQPDATKKEREKEQTVSVDQLPAAVKATLTKEAGAGKIAEVEKKTSRGRTVYEADVIVEQKKWEITIREDGQLLKKELDEEQDDEDNDDDDSDR